MLKLKIAGVTRAASVMVCWAIADSDGTVVTTP